MITRLACAAAFASLICLTAGTARAQYQQPLHTMSGGSAEVPMVPAVGLTDIPSALNVHSHEERFLTLQAPLVYTKEQGLFATIGLSMTPFGLLATGGEFGSDPGWPIGLLSGLNISMAGTTVPRPETQQPVGMAGAAQWSVNSRNPYQNSTLLVCLRRAATADEKRSTCYHDVDMSFGMGYGRTVTGGQSGWLSYGLAWSGSNLDFTGSGLNGLDGGRATATPSGDIAYTWHAHLPDWLGHRPYSLSGDVGGSVVPVLNSQTRLDGFTGGRVGLGLSHGLMLGFDWRFLPVGPVDTNGNMQPSWRGALILGWGAINGAVVEYTHAYDAAHKDEY